jgi:hypothetical protein
MVDKSPNTTRAMDADGALAAAEQQRRRRCLTVIVMRHGVALHNVSDPATPHHHRRLDDPALTDPPLIETGRIQAVQAGTRIAEWWRRQQQPQQQYPLYGCGGNNDDDTPIDLVVVSPLSRCIETAVLAFGPAPTGAPPPIRRFVCHEDVREAFGRHYPDKRSEKSILEVRFCRTTNCTTAQKRKQWTLSVRFVCVRLALIFTHVVLHLFAAVCLGMYQNTIEELGSHCGISVDHDGTGRGLDC